MHSLITSYLLQSKECILPGIGVLQIIHTPASTDAVNRRILPPFEEVIFKKEDHSNSPGFVRYIAAKKNTGLAEADELLNIFCKECNEKINAGEKLTLETIGSIQKNADGIIIFERENNTNFLQPIPVDNVYQRTDQPVSVEREPVLEETNEYKEEQKFVIERSYWGLWALILFAIGAVFLFYNFKDHKLSGSSVGNQNHFVVDSAKATYHK